MAVVTRLAVLSDVHSNLHALEAVLDDVEEEDVAATVFLGDAVGYNAYPAACLDRLRSSCSTMVRGNHDHAVVERDASLFNPAAQAGIAHSREHLNEDDVRFLADLPLQAEVERVHLVHGSPADPLHEYVYRHDEQRLRQLIAHPSVGEAKVIAMGHTHVPFVGEAEGTMVVNPGSVGQPRDGDSRSSWALVETEGPTAKIRRTAYDVEEAAAAVREADLPTHSAERLLRGR